MSLASSAIIYNIVKVKVTCWPVWPVDLLEKEPNSNCVVHLHMPLICISKRRRIRLCSWGTKAKGAFCSCVVRGWSLYNIVESESYPLTFSKKNPSRAIPRSTYIHPPSLAKIRQRTSEEIGNKQTNAARIIVWFVSFIVRSFCFKTGHLNLNNIKKSYTMYLQTLFYNNWHIFSMCKGVWCPYM